MMTVVTMAVGLGGIAQAGAYEETTVANGGTVTGTVQFTGELPEPTRFELRRYYDRAIAGPCRMDLAIGCFAVSRSAHSRA